METGNAILAAEDERRLHIRYNISLSANVLTSSTALKAKITEISVFGLRIRSRRLIFPDTNVRVYLEPDNDILIVGKVIWVLTDFDSSGKTYYDSGIRIDEIIMPGAKAAGLAARSEFVSDILLTAKERQLSE